jgi:hypothetical protein
MDAWTLLTSELSYYGIRLINERKCQLLAENGEVITQGIIKTIRQINQIKKKYKQDFSDLWDEAADLLNEECCSYLTEPLNNKIIDLFIFSLKDLSKLLLCFCEADNSFYQKVFESALNKDIKDFSKKQVYTLPDYKIAIDVVHRLINRLSYIAKLLSFAAMGKKKVRSYDIKVARGISGPWSNLDLPMEERVFPFGKEIKQREKDKQRQRRYRKGLENYNNDGRVGEGHYWREPRNEPFSWESRRYNDPYPHRSLLNR